MMTFHLGVAEGNRRVASIKKSRVDLTYANVLKDIALRFRYF